MPPERTLTDADVAAIVDGLYKRVEEGRAGVCPADCRFNKKEAECVHTLGKYVPSHLLPLLGKFLKTLNKSSSDIGLWIIRISFILGIGSFVVWILFKVGVLKMTTTS